MELSTDGRVYRVYQLADESNIGFCLLMGHAVAFWTPRLLKPLVVPLVDYLISSFDDFV